MKEDGKSTKAAILSPQAQKKKKKLSGSLYNLSEGKMPLYKYSLSYCFIVNYLINRARLLLSPKSLKAYVKINE